MRNVQLIIWLFILSAVAQAGDTNFINIINFIRAVEPREEVDLVEPVRQQIALADRYNLPVTWLVQYDALLNDDIVALLKGLDSRHEVGAWFEVVEPIVTDAGLTWRGRFPWDWHSDVGFTIGYTQQEREKLADVFMAKFKQVFGFYPASVGSWFIDAFTLNYLFEKYGICASCNAKDQIGTDGYTLWGGFYNQAYYPSKINAYMPAQTAANQIDVPIFRMLGNDPIYAYDYFVNNIDKISSLEPVYAGSGGNPDWVRWFFDVNFSAPSLAFGYTQAGQENSFGWARMSKGLEFQIPYIAGQVQQGVVLAVTLKDAAAWYKNNFKLTTPCAITALTDWQGQNRKSVWFYSRFYRAGLFAQDGHLWFRDMHKFDETVPSRYYKTVCTTPNCTWDTLPVLDGASWSDDTTQARMSILTKTATGWQPVSDNITVTEQENQTLVVDVAESVHIVFAEKTIEIHGEFIALEMTWAATKPTALREVQEHKLFFRHNNFDYAVALLAGSVKQHDEHRLLIVPEEKRIVFGF